MKRFVSAWNMRRLRDAFTLIEVMIAVMIISVVIMALLTMQGNNSHIFSKFNKQLRINQFVSFFIANNSYGFEKKSVALDDLLQEFPMEDDLRRELKEIKVQLSYERLKTVDFSEDNGDENSQDEGDNASSNMVFEIGKSVLHVEDVSSFLIRFKLQ